MPLHLSGCKYYWHIIEKFVINLGLGVQAILSSTACQVLPLSSR